MNRDLEHLRLLSVFHYVFGGLTAFFACIPFPCLIFGIVMIAAPQIFDDGEPPPAFLGWVLAILGATAILAGWTFAGLLLYAGRCLARKKHYVFCMVVAVLSCLQMPFGTVLGVFALIVLVRPSVKELFAPGGRPQAEQTPAPQ